MSKKLENIEFVNDTKQNAQEANLRSNEVQEILTKIPSWMIRWGNTLIFIFLLLIVFVSWLIKYPDIITAKAVITTNIPPENVVAKTTGKIQELFVKENDTVVVNQSLAIIENAANYNDVLLLKKLMSESIMTKDSIYFPTQKLPLLQLGALNSDFADFQDKYLSYVLEKELNPLQYEKSAQKYSKAEINKRIKQLQRQKQIQYRNLQLKRKDYNRYKELFEKGIVSEVKLETKLSELLQQKNAVNAVASQISTLKEQLHQTETNTGITDVKQTQQDTRLQQKVFQSFEKLKGKIGAWERKYVLQSTSNGKVSFLKVWTKNQQVTNGETVFVIIPTKFTHYIAKILAPANNSGKLKIGQKVQIKMQNYPFEEFGAIIGKVDKISEMPDAKGNYFIDVALPKTLKTSYNKTIQYKQDMRGRAEIITEDLRVIERIFYRFRKIFSH